MTEQTNKQDSNIVANEEVNKMTKSEMIKIIKSPHLGRHYNLDELEKALDRNFKGFNVTLKNNLEYKDETSCDHLFIATIQNDIVKEDFKIWYLMDRCNRITITEVENHNEKELTCSECGSDDIVGHCSEDIDREDYDNDKDYEEALLNLSDYECNDCGKEWDIE